MYTVKKCVIKGKTYDKYNVKCKLVQNGEKEFLYKSGCLYLERDNKQYDIDANSKEVIIKEIESFEKDIQNIKKVNNSSPIKIFNNQVFLFIKRNGIDDYDVLLECGKAVQCKYIKNISVTDIIKTYDFNFAEPNKNVIEYYGKITENPIYQFACKYDKFMRFQIEMLYGFSTKQTRQYLREQDGVLRIGGGKEYEDKFYYISKNEIDFNVVKKSGYTIYHIPCSPLMEGKTYNIFAFNPNKMLVKDAALINSEVVSFKTFCSML